MNFKFGIVSEAKPGFAKVYFQQDNFVTDWMPIVSPFSMKDKVGYVLNAKEHVACLCDQRCEEGVILGAIHSNPEPADTDATKDKFRTVYEDGSVFEYDKATHKYSINIQSAKLGVDGKFLIQSGSDTLKQVLNLIIQAVQQIVVLEGNNPDYTKLTQAATKTDNIFN